MMEMNLDQVAMLARIKLEDKEKKSLAQDLEKILSYINQLKQVDTRDVPPTSHVLALENVFREDKLLPQRVVGQALRHAPAREGDFFKVPKVIEGE